MSDNEVDTSAEHTGMLAGRRAAVRLLRAAAAEMGVRVETFCGEWVVRLIHPAGRTRLVWGYNFDLNPSAGAQIAKDKAASFEVLRAAGVAAVEHRLFLRADLQEYVPEHGNWRAMLVALEDFGGQAVIKPAEGSGGAGVSRVRSPRELERTAGELWLRHHAICLSPLVNIGREVRHILLDGEAAITYEKQIHTIVGDGRSTFGELLVRKAESSAAWPSLLAAAARLHRGREWNQVPREGERLPLEWRHNLRGAGARLLDRPDDGMLRLARRAAEALGLRLGAVDVIVPEEERAAPIVLEVNAGLMLERFVEQVPGGWERALSLTREVVRKMFEM